MDFPWSHTDGTSKCPRRNSFRRHICLVSTSVFRYAALHCSDGRGRTPWSRQGISRIFTTFCLGQGGRAGAGGGARPGGWLAGRGRPCCSFTASSAAGSCRALPQRKHLLPQQYTRDLCKASSHSVSKGDTIDIVSTSNRSGSVESTSIRWTLSNKVLFYRWRRGVIRLSENTVSKNVWAFCFRWVIQLQLRNVRKDFQNHCPPVTLPRPVQNSSGNDVKTVSERHRLAHIGIFSMWFPTAVRTGCRHTYRLLKWWWWWSLVVTCKSWDTLRSGLLVMCGLTPLSLGWLQVFKLPRAASHRWHWHRLGHRNRTSKIEPSHSLSTRQRIKGIAWKHRVGNWEKRNFTQLWKKIVRHFCQSWGISLNDSHVNELSPYSFLILLFNTSKNGKYIEYSLPTNLHFVEDPPWLPCGQNIRGLKNALKKLKLNKNSKHSHLITKRSVAL